MENYDLIEIGGGNPYFLLKMAKEKHFDEFLENYFNNHLIIGISAGSLLMQKSIDIVNNF